MSRLEKRVNLVAVALPFAAFIAAIVLLWNSAVSATDLGILAVMYVITGLGVTVGFHRLLTHRSFVVPKPLEYTFAILGSMAVQGPVMSWVADHRKHHAHADEEGDPHSPHVGHGDGFSGVMRGLWHAHTGWLFSTQGRASARQYAKDLYEDRGMRRINRSFPYLVALSLLLPALVGWAITGTWIGALTGYLWGGLVRIHQRGLALAALVRGVLAPQPPRLPSLSQSRPAPVGDAARSLRPADRRTGEGGAGAQRGPDRARAPGPARAHGGAGEGRSACFALRAPRNPC